MCFYSEFKTIKLQTDGNILAGEPQPITWCYGPSNITKDHYLFIQKSVVQSTSELLYPPGTQPTAQRADSAVQYIVDYCAKCSPPVCSFSCCSIIASRDSQLCKGLLKRTLTRSHDEASLLILKLLFVDRDVTHSYFTQLISFFRSAYVYVFPVRTLY